MSSLSDNTGHLAHLARYPVSPGNTPSVPYITYPQPRISLAGRVSESQLTSCPIDDTPT